MGELELLREDRLLAKLPEPVMIAPSKVPSMDSELPKAIMTCGLPGCETVSGVCDIAIVEPDSALIGSANTAAINVHATPDAKAGVLRTRIECCWVFKILSLSVTTTAEPVRCFEEQQVIHRWRQQHGQ